jgi:hypothetical protein
MDDHSDRLAAAIADRYRIERKLGAGGLVLVCRASEGGTPVRGPNVASAAQWNCIWSPRSVGLN